MTRGTKRPERVPEKAAAASLRPTDAELARLDRLAVAGERETFAL